MTIEKDMTLEELEEYRGLASEMKALQMQIDGLYDTYKSPQMVDDAGGGGSGNPTERAVMQILELKREYAKKFSDMSEKLLRVENWLSSVDDVEIRSIVRFHFILNKSWQQTSTMVYGYPSYYNSRKRIMRFFGKEA